MGLHVQMLAQYKVAIDEIRIGRGFDGGHDDHPVHVRCDGARLAPEVGSGDLIAPHIDGFNHAFADPGGMPQDVIAANGLRRFAPGRAPPKASIPRLDDALCPVVDDYQPGVVRH